MLLMSRFKKHKRKTPYTEGLSMIFKEKLAKDTLVLTASGIATPGHTWAYAHIKFAGAPGKNNVKS